MFQNSQENKNVGVSFSIKLQLNGKRDSDVGVFLLILQKN